MFDVAAANAVQSAPIVRAFFESIRNVPHSDNVPRLPKNSSDATSPFATMWPIDHSTTDH